MVDEGILTLDLHGFAVKDAILVEIIAGLFNESPVLVIAGARTLVLDPSNEPGVKNPVYQIIFVFEMIVEAFAVHVAPLTDLAHIDFFKGKLHHHTAVPTTPLLKHKSTIESVFSQQDSLCCFGTNCLVCPKM